MNTSSVQHARSGPFSSSRLAILRHGPAGETGARGAREAQALLCHAPSSKLQLARSWTVGCSQRSVARSSSVRRAGTSPAPRPALPGPGKPGATRTGLGSSLGVRVAGATAVKRTQLATNAQAPPSATHPSEGCPRALRSLRKKKAAPRNRRPAGAPPPPLLRGQTATPNVPGRRAGRGAPWAHPGRLPGVRPSETRGRGARFLGVGGAGRGATPGERGLRARVDTG